WAAANRSGVFSLAASDTALYAGIVGPTSGSTASQFSEIWKYEESSWTQVGGGTTNDSAWQNYNNAYANTVRSLEVTDEGDLYAGIGRYGAYTSTANPGSGQVWQFADDAWSLVGGFHRNG